MKKRTISIPIIVYFTLVITSVLLYKVEPPELEGFYKAIDSNDIIDFKELYKNNGEVIGSPEVFFYAMEKNNIEVVEFLYQKGIDINIMGGEDLNTAFLHAVKLNNTKMANFLYKNNFDILYNNQHYLIAPQIAAENGSLEMLEFLYSISSEWEEHLFESSLTPFIYGVKSGNIEVVNFYLKRGEDINQVAYDDTNAIYYSLKNNDYEMTRFLIDNGVNVNCMWESGATPLMFAIESKSIDLVKLLLNNKTKIFPEGINSKMLISAVVKADLYEIADMVLNKIENGSELLEKGYNFSVINDTPNSYTYFVKRVKTLPDDFDSMYINNTINNSPKNVKAMIDMGFPVDRMIQSDPAAPALAHAAACNLVEIGQILIDAGADVNKIDAIGQTPLMDASYNGYLDFVKLLLDNSAVINNSCDLGYTPLHYSVLSENHELVKYLLENGANPHTKNKYSRTPLEIAKDESIKELLRKYMK